MKRILSLLLGLCWITFAAAQTGTVAGKIIEKESGFEVIGGNVLVIGTPDKGTVSDLDGNYSLKLAPGTYSLEFSYIGFASQTITDIVVNEGEITHLDVQMSEEAIELDLDVTVRAKAYRNTEAAILLLQKKSPVVMDGISAAQISKSGDSDVAAAVKRVSGVTVEGGKYVYVRGLGDRYSKTTLNGAEVPGLDPSRNTVQMDLFPTNLIDNIIIYKTFSPHLPGSFTGGLVDIATKDFPDRFNLAASASLSFNSNANFNDQFLTYQGGSKDWLGFDDGTREIPQEILSTEIPQYGNGWNDPTAARSLTELTRAFDNNWEFGNQSNFFTQSYSVSIGDQKNLFGKPIGFNTALSYSRSYSAYSDGQSGVFKLSGAVATTESLNPQISLTEQQGSEDILWGALFGASYKLTDNSKIGLTLMHNQSATSQAFFGEGSKSSDDKEEVFQTRKWDFIERGLSTAQLKGKHVVSDWNNFEINWQGSYTLSKVDQPDLRFFNNRYIPSEDRYRLKPSSDLVPTRIFRDMEQDNWHYKLDFSLPFTQWTGRKSKLDFGGSYVARARAFGENRYNFNNNTFAIPDGDPFRYFSEENLLQVDDEGAYLNAGNGVYVVDNTVSKNTYDANSAVSAGYAMIELPLSKKWRIITGARVEQTDIQLKTFSEALLATYPLLDGESDLLNNFDVLPSVNINYEFSEKAKLRLAYNRTLARPTFRELAPVDIYDPTNQSITVGNPDLQRTLIDNLDLRCEWYPNPGEIISVSAFYKNFMDPIEKVLNTEAANTEFTWRNVAEAYLFGGEVEFRKKLDFVNALKGFSLGANFAYIYSQTEIDPKELELILQDDPDAESTREMFGQAPYSLNALLSYKHESGLDANLSFNMVGPRIISVSRGATPNFYLNPQPLLNFNVSHQLSDQFKIKLAANNILNSEYKEVVTYKEVEYPLSVFKPGTTFSLGVSYKWIK